MTALLRVFSTEDVSITQLINSTEDASITQVINSTEDTSITREINLDLDEVTNKAVPNTGIWNWPDGQSRSSAKTKQNPNRIPVSLTRSLHSQQPWCNPLWLTALKAQLTNSTRKKQVASVHQNPSESRGASLSESLH